MTAPNQGILYQSMFVTIEGGEGAGKSTLINSLKDHLASSHQPVLFTREPGGSRIGPQIRDLVLNGDKLSTNAELFLFLADRAEHVETIIKPYLNNGGTVICDRFIHSTLAYQGYGRGIDLEKLRYLNNIATGGLSPDLTIFLDIKPEISLQRGLKNDRMDLESRSFHDRVYEGFVAEMERDASRWLQIDATLPPEEVATIAINELNKLLVGNN